MRAKTLFKWAAIAVGALLGVAILVLGFKVMGFNRAVARVYDVSPLSVTASQDSAVIARGEHLASSIGGCRGCHGLGLQGTAGEPMGPIGVIHTPNLTTGAGGIGGSYSDGELARAVRHGINRDGRTLLFMPASDFNWWPDEDLVAIVSYIRSVPPIDNETEKSEVRLLGKLLDQFGLLPLTVAARIDHDAPRPDVPDPEPTATYGGFVATVCAGCHGPGLTGGRIPGTPAEIPAPANLTPHETGLATWTEDDFVTALFTGVRPDGRTLDEFMPRMDTMSEIETAALWAYLRSLDPREYGNR